MSYFVYILKCSDNTYYTGVARDVAARLIEHNEGKLGAKYTKSRRPVQLLWSETVSDRGTALKREYAIKQLTRLQKEELINS